MPSKILKPTWLLVLWLFSINSFAQSNFRGVESFVYPNEIPSGSFKHLIGLSWATLPEDVIEIDDLFQAPLFSYSVKFGLPKNFVINASVNTNFITFQFVLGAKWNYRIDKFSFAPGYDLAFFFGQLKKFGFDSRITGWINYPNFTAGYAFNNFTISVKGELILVTNINEYQDDLKLSRDNNFFSGYAITAAIEQPLWKESYLLIALKLNYTKFYYPQWAAFSTFNRLLFIPEIMVGFIL